MPLPSEPVTLTVEQLKELNGKLSAMRHDINGQLALIVASVELSRMMPETIQARMAAVAEQPAKISAILARFSAEFEQAFGITRRQPGTAATNPSAASC